MMQIGKTSFVVVVQKKCAQALNNACEIYLLKFVSKESLSSPQKKIIWQGLKNVRITCMVG